MNIKKTISLCLVTTSVLSSMVVYGAENTPSVLNALVITAPINEIDSEGIVVKQEEGEEVKQEVKQEEGEEVAPGEDEEVKQEEGEEVAPEEDEEVKQEEDEEVAPEEDEEAILGEGGVLIPEEGIDMKLMILAEEVGEDSAEVTVTKSVKLEDALAKAGFDPTIKEEAEKLKHLVINAEAEIATADAKVIMKYTNLETFEMKGSGTIKGNKIGGGIFGNAAGNGLHYLKSIKAPMITDLSAAFANCPALEEVELGGVTSIGAYSFYNCGSLKTISFNNIGQIPLLAKADEDPEDTWFDGVPKSLIIKVPDNKVEMFQNSDEFREYTIEGLGYDYTDETDLPDATKDMVIDTFATGKLETAIKVALKGIEARDYNDIKTLIINEGTLDATDCKFINTELKKLEELHIVEDANFTATKGSTDGVIPNAAFRGHKTLKVFEATNAKMVDKDALSLIPSMELIDLPNVEEIKTRAFAMQKFSNDSQLKEIRLPSLKTMAERTFYYCVRLEKLVLGEEVPIVTRPEGKEGLWFNYVTNLTVYIPFNTYNAYIAEENVTELDWSAFNLKPIDESEGTFPEPSKGPEYVDAEYNFLRDKYSNPKDYYYKGDIELSLNMYSFNSPINRALKVGAEESVPSFGESVEDMITTKDAIRWAKDNGFKAVDLTFYYVPGYSNTDMPTLEQQAQIKECVIELREYCKEIDIAISGTGMQNSFSDASAKRVQTDINRMKFWMDMAELLEAPCMRIFTGTAPVDINRKGWKDIMDNRIIPAIEEVAEHGQENGYKVQIGIQNHGDMLATANQVLYIMDYFLGKGYSNVGVVNDTGYFREFGAIEYPSAETCYAEVKRVLPVSNNFQLKKKPRGAESSELIDLERIFQDMRYSDYFNSGNKRYVPLEVLWAPKDSDYPENLDGDEVVESYKAQIIAFRQKVEKTVEATKNMGPEEGNDGSSNGGGGGSSSGNTPSNDPSKEITNRVNVDGIEVEYKKDSNGSVIITLDKLTLNQLLDKADGGKYPYLNIVSIGEVGSVILDLPTDLGSKVKVTFEADKEVLSNNSVIYNVKTGEIVPFSAKEGQTVSFIAESSGEYAVKANNKSFNDIAQHWGRDNIAFVTSREIFSGMGDNNFAPNSTMTRGMFVTALARLDNADLSDRRANFSDIKETDWFAQPVAWAADKGIVTGVAAGVFDPNGHITREQMALIMSNYIAHKKITLDKVKHTPNFRDTENTHSWAKDAVDRIFEAGIISGKEDNTFDAQGEATRAEVATMIANFIRVTMK